MNSAMILTRFRPEHQTAILALHRSAMQGFDVGIDPREEEVDLLEIDRYYLHAGGEFLVGMLDDNVVAMGGFKRRSETSAELKRMRIAKQLQGRGYGSRLLTELEQSALSCGIRTLCLETAGFRTLAMEFYRKHHYQVAGQGRYGGIDTVRFTKSLKSAAVGETNSIRE